MKVSVKKSFEKDIEKISDKKLASQISVAIDEMEKCKKLSELSHLKRCRQKEIITGCVLVIIELVLR
jgi:hypothetical protein